MLSFEGKQIFWKQQIPIGETSSVSVNRKQRPVANAVSGDSGVTCYSGLVRVARIFWRKGRQKHSPCQFSKCPERRLLPCFRWVCSDYLFTVERLRHRKINERSDDGRVAKVDPTPVQNYNAVVRHHYLQLIEELLHGWSHIIACGSFESENQGAAHALHPRPDVAFSVCFRILRAHTRIL
jgi:hypothetical protein